MASMPFQVLIKGKKTMLLILTFFYVIISKKWEKTSKYGIRY